MLTALSQFIFGNSGGLFGRGRGGSGQSKDRRICFDLRSSELELESGEILLAAFFPIEDVKGNPDKMGLLKVTNLRILWICVDNKALNLSIGWNTVSLVFEQNYKDAFGDPIGALVLMTSQESSNYEFVFMKMRNNNDDGTAESWFATNYWIPAMLDRKLFVQLTPNNQVDCYDVIFTVWKGYTESLLFRECQTNIVDLIPPLAQGESAASLGNSSKQRVAQLTREAINFSKLPTEETIHVYGGVIYVESRDNQHVGTLVLTNIRILWIDDKITVRNISIPYTRIESVKTKQASKLLIDTMDFLSTKIEFNWRKATGLGGDRALGCELPTQIQNFYLHYKGKPRFGPESRDDCLDIANYLRPLEELAPIDGLRAFKFPDQTSSLAIGTQPSTNTQQQQSGSGIIIDINAGNKSQKTKDLITCVSKQSDNRSRKEKEKFELNERELNKYMSKTNKRKFASYATEGKPVIEDQPIVYSPELGLSLERPPNGASVADIWRIEL